MTEKKPSVKILIGYFKPCYLLKNTILTPIHLGRACAKEASRNGALDRKDIKWMKHHMIGDDTGENISKYNRQYCEVTAQYWAWKNYEKLGNPDYIGFMHHRRHFLFKDTLYKGKELNVIEKCYSRIHLPFVSEDYMEQAGLTEETIRDTCTQYDCIVVEQGDMRLLNFTTLRDDYELHIDGSHVEDFDLMLKTIVDLYPEYKEEVKELKGTYSKYFYNMFIMKKELFFDCCEFMFRILETLRSKIDVSSYSVNGKRTLGYLSELVFCVYMYKLRKNPHIKIKELKVAYFEDPQAQKNLVRKYRKLKNRYIKYRILSELTWGKRQKKIKEKRNSLKLKMKQFKTLNKEALS